ncbi:hypothetical protein GBF38_000817 [Nibea albiflora]|nr:hypothetical protein GBF38_000817 [Nibea albiflora]
MRIAKNRIQRNLYLAAVYLEQRAKRGERIEDEAQAFSQARGAAEGPWLVVTTGTWLAAPPPGRPSRESGLPVKGRHPDGTISISIPGRAPPGDIYAEKAWTLMKFSADKKLLAADYFQRAIR